MPPAAHVELRHAPDQQAVDGIDPGEAALSKKKAAVVLRLWPANLEDGLVDASIIVANTGWDRLQISRDDLSVTSASGQARLLGAEEMLARARRGAPQRALPRSASAALSSVAGSLSSEVGTADGVVKGSPVASTYSVTSGGRDEESGANSGDDSALGDEERARITAWYLDTMLIPPGETGTGGITIELPPGSEALTVTVSVAGELHTFELVHSAPTGR